jgi:SAM-dependent methyltransferase
MNRDEAAGAHERMVTFYHGVDGGTGFDAVDRLLDLEARLGVTATYNIDAPVFLSQPALVARILESGHEVALHQSAPGSAADVPTGLRWSAEPDEAREPYFVRRGLVRLPIAAGVDGFEAALETRRYFGWRSHEDILSPGADASLGAYARLIELARARRVLPVTFAQAADLYRRAALAALYDRTAAAWNQRTRVLYRTRRFEEIIRDETIRLDRPSVVDLGSGGGALTATLSDIASVIYCVDNSAGMLEQLPAADVVRPILGEVTHSTLPDGAADLIVCARVLEYVYDPAFVADEIRRIGKKGATVIATFPALGDEAPANDPRVDALLRKAFTREDVAAWGRLVGAGNVFPVQYDAREPSGPAEEAAYRELERIRPPDRIPTNWVFVGRVAGPRIAAAGYRLQPISPRQFSFARPK